MTDSLASMIAARWPTAEAFYDERDDRTRREVPAITAYAQRPIEILIDPDAASLATTQRLALVAANLTARWARRLSVIVPDVKVVEPLRRGRFHTLGERIRAEIEAADPFGDFNVGPAARQTASDDHSMPLRLAIGPFRNRGLLAPDDYVITADGWNARGKRGRGFQAPLDQVTAAGAIGLAAALGVADLFKRAIAQARAEWMPDFAWSLWTHELAAAEAILDEGPEMTATFDLHRTLLAGTGAIGSAIVYLIDLAEPRGLLGLVDRDRVELSNLNRTPLFTVADVLDHLEKTEAARRYLAWQGLTVEASTGTWAELSAGLLAREWDVLISLTNEDGVWAGLPFQLPPIVLHGTTTSGWGFGFGRHIPRVEDCTLCRMPRPQAAFRGPCAEGEIAPAPTASPVRAALPFLSVASAALVVAELAKLGSSYLLDLPNDVAADLRYGLPAVIATNVANDLDCRGCQISHLSAWKAAGGRGRFSVYSFYGSPQNSGKPT